MEIAGRRQRKRYATRLKIIEAAATAFKNGFEQVRIEEIAALADVAAGTVYNHFPTKDALLIAYASHHRTELPKALSALLSMPPKDPVEAFVQLYKIMTTQSLRYLDKSLWRHVHAALTAGGWHEHGNERWRHEEELITYQRSLIKWLQQAGSISRGIDDRILAELIHSTAFFWWQRFLAEDEMHLDTFAVRVRDALTFIFTALATLTAATTRPTNVTKRKYRQGPQTG